MTLPKALVNSFLQIVACLHQGNLLASCTLLLGQKLKIRGEKIHGLIQSSISEPLWDLPRIKAGLLLTLP